MSSFLTIKSWERFQHYKDRDPPWIKFYRDILTSESWVLGTDASRLLQSASVLLAARYGNQIPYRYDLIKKVASLDLTERQFKEAVAHLAQTNFLEIQELPIVSNPVAQDASKPLSKCSSETEKSREETEKSREESGGHRADARSTDDHPADGKRKEPVKTATRLPADWPLTPERQAVAVAERIDPGRTHAKFCDYWRALNGAKARKLDWEATWRNWCRTDADRNRPPSGSAPKESYADRSSREFMERMAARDKIEAEEAASANH